MLGPTGQIEVTAVHWLMGGLLVIVGGWSARYAPAMWRGGQHARRVQHLLEVFGEPTAIALASVVPLASIVCIVGGALGLTLFTRELAQGDLLTLTTGVGNGLAVVFSACLLIGFSIFLFGRPKLLMPPHTRGQHGFLGQLLSRLWPRD